TFKDVAGVEEATEELEEIIDYLKTPQKFTALGAKIPRGVLLIGPPGTGKTLLARAISGEADVPFYTISGSDFVEMFVGVGAARVRDLFEQARAHGASNRKGCIVFIDEIDAVGRQRGAGLGGGHDEREQTLNQLLVEMDGFDNTTGIIVIAATNRPDVLDPALLRAGRFDRQVVVHLPDIKGREAILKVHSVDKIPLDPDVDLKVIARGTPNFSGADLANLINEAALLAARNDQETVTMKDMEEARDKVMMGPERRSRVISDKERKNTAYHEAGHALLATLLEYCDPLHKVTIIPRGLSAGSTWTLPLEDVHNWSKTQLLDRITMSLGGRAAEVVVFDDLTTGAGHDMRTATQLVHKMTCEWGMSDELGPMTFGRSNDLVFRGRELTRSRDFSESTAVEIDNEVRRCIDACYTRALGMIKEHRENLDDLAEELIEREVLTGEEVTAIIDGTYTPPEDPEEPEEPKEEDLSDEINGQETETVFESDDDLVGAET
ncbi:MAG: ATP-dependent zinc metalloprotease FtsH, partial [bacterium]|nr:ATP-dependent zinc metalloprotease FtsH [bacterium]